MALRASRKPPWASVMLSAQTTRTTCPGGAPYRRVAVTVRRALCSSEKRAKGAAKARATAAPFTSTGLNLKRELTTGPMQFPLKVRSKKLQRLKSSAILRRRPEAALPEACTTMLASTCSAALFVLDGCVGCRRRAAKARRSLSCTLVTFTLTRRHLEDDGLREVVNMQIFW